MIFKINCKSKDILEVEQICMYMYILRIWGLKGKVKYWGFILKWNNFYGL